MIHYIQTTDTVELTVPVAEEEPDYTVLWIVIVSLCAVVLLLSVSYNRKKQKKNDGEAGSIIIEPSEPPVLPKYDFSGQLSVYLLKGEQEDDIPPCNIKLFGKSRKVYPLTGLKTAAGLITNYRTRIKSGLPVGKTMRCVSKIPGTATIVKENQILKNGRENIPYIMEKKYC